MTIGGCDLVTPISRQVVTHEGDALTVFSCITANPAYWTGTRIAGIAPLYQDYRPLKMIFRYIPQVAVTQSGTVVMGTIWKGASPSSDFQQTLVTSNGGNMINCYIPANSAIELGANLDRNLYGVSGELSPETNPFLFLATTRGCLDAEGNQVVPGYFYVEYVFRLKNPIGEAWKFIRSAEVTTPYTGWSLPNRSLVLLEQNGNYGPGTVLDVEEEQGSYIVKYRGSPVDLTDGTAVQAFENGQAAVGLAEPPATSDFSWQISGFATDVGRSPTPITWVTEGSVSASTSSRCLLLTKYSSYVAASIETTNQTLGGDKIAAFSTGSGGGPVILFNPNGQTIAYVAAGSYAWGPYTIQAPSLSARSLTARLQALEQRLKVVEDDDVALVPLATRKLAQ